MVFFLKLAGERTKSISLVNIVVLSIYAFSIIGTMSLFYHLNEYRTAAGVVDQNLIFDVLLYSSINLIFLLFGVIFTRRVVGLKPQIGSRVTHRLGIKQIIGLLALFVVSVATCLFYLSQINSVALLIALTSGAKEAAVSRSLMGNDFSGKSHWYRLFMNDMSQFIAYALFANWLVYKTKRGLVYFCCAFLYATIVAILATEKGPVVWFLIGLFFVYNLVKNNGFMPLESIGKLLIVLVAGLILMYIYFMDSSDLFGAFSSIFSRTFTGQITPAYFYIQYFPGVKDYMIGGTFPNPGGILPFTPFNYTVVLHEWSFPDVAGTGAVGSMPTVFWGESYANFGPLGIPFIAILVGILLATVSWVISHINWSPVGVGFYVWLIIHYKDLSGTGYSNYFVDTSVLVMLSLFFLIVIIGGGVKLKYTRFGPEGLQMRGG